MYLITSLKAQLKYNLYSESFPEPLQLEFLILSSEFHKDFICMFLKASSLHWRSDSADAQRGEVESLAEQS